MRTFMIYNIGKAAKTANLFRANHPAYLPKAKETNSLLIQSSEERHLVFDQFRDYGSLRRKKWLSPIGMIVTLLLPPSIMTVLVTGDQTIGAARLAADSTRNTVDDEGHERLKVMPLPLVQVKFTSGGGLISVMESSCNICQRKLSELASVVWTTEAKLVVAPPPVKALPPFFDLIRQQLVPSHRSCHLLSSVLRSSDWITGEPSEVKPPLPMTFPEDWLLIVK